MSKCPFCEIPCGNSHCAYAEETDVLTQAIEAGLRPTKMKVTRKQAVDINRVYYNNLDCSGDIICIEFINNYKVYIDSQHICRIEIIEEITK